MSLSLFTHNRLKQFLILVFTFLAVLPAGAQTPFLMPDYRPDVIINGSPLKFPWTGGVNSPVVNQIDLNGDGFQDILLFDRVGNRISTFLNDGIALQSSFSFAPEYLSLFPPLHDWVKTADYDCDGDMDLFTYTNAAIGVFRNDFTTGAGLQFTPVTSQLNSLYDTLVAAIFVSQVNLPAFADVDGDSDMDIIAFTNSGNYLEFHKNYSFDSTGICDGFNFKLQPECWGKFQLSGLSNVGLLNQNCTVSRFAGNRHSGSVLAPLDQGCDGDIDLLNGDILGENMLFLENGGTPDSAWITSQDSAFPSYDISLLMQNLPGPYYLDIDNDGNKDLIIAPFATVGEDYYNMHLYRNTTDNCTNIFERTNRRFLAEDMIDVGTAASVAFTDVDADGLMDIIAGNDLYYNPDPLLSVSRLAFFRNTGTAVLPEYTLISDDWLNTSSLQAIGLFPAFGDVDADGDTDLLLGNADGKLIYYSNSAGSGNPLTLSLSQPVYQGIDVGNNSTPQIIDVDGDGLVDLLIGERAGNLNYYRNTGTASAPVFSLTSAQFGNVSVLQAGAIAGYSIPLLFDSAGTYQLLVGSESGSIYQFTNIDGNLQGSFTLVDSVYQGIRELRRVTLAMSDVDADGKFDLLTGCNAGGMRLYTQDAASSLPEPDVVSFMLFPNPANGTVWIRMNNTPDTGGYPIRSVKIFDISGRECMHATVDNVFASFDITGLHEGIYLVKVLMKDKAFVQKLVIRH
jgi:hypothetical protein